jgi:phosphoribosylanthranilate isomerase
MIDALKIKVCGMRQPGNISDVCQLKPDYLGLIFYPNSPRYVTDENAEPILDAIPDSVVKVGVFVNEHLSEIIKITNLFKLKTLQLHGQESPEYCMNLKELGFTVIKAFGVDKNFSFKILENYQSCCDYFLFDTKSVKHGGTGKKFDWKLLNGYNNSKPIFLSGGIDSDDASEIMELSHLNIYSLDINSRFETEPGLKDIDKLNTFINNIRLQKI